MVDGKNYQITFSTQLRQLRVVIIYNILMVLTYWYVHYYIEHENGTGLAELVFGIGYGVCMLPVIFLHTEYFIRNRRQVIYINNEEHLITLNHVIIGNFTDIAKITFYMSPAYKYSGIRSFPFEHYRYAKIIFKDGSHYLFTSLMCYNVEEPFEIFEELNKEVKVRLFASPLLG